MGRLLLGSCCPFGCTVGATFQRQHPRLCIDLWRRLVADQRHFLARTRLLLEPQSRVASNCIIAACAGDVCTGRSAVSDTPLHPAQPLTELHSCIV